MLKNKKRLLVIIFTLFFTVACSCGLVERLFSSDSKQVVVDAEDGSLSVNATAAAESEFAIQTQIAALSATQQAIMERMEATVESVNGPAVPTEPINWADYQTPVPPGVTSLTVSVDTNCRSGPGLGYQIVDGVFVGQTVEVLGKDASGAYYIVKSPQGYTCWLWSHYATLNGDPNTLTVMTPPVPEYHNINLDWEDWLIIEPVRGFSWEGLWVAGAPGNQPLGEWYNAQIVTCPDCFRIQSTLVEITRSGDMLDIIVTEDSYWLDGNTTTHMIYGVAEVSPDNTMAVGLFYLEEVTAHSISGAAGHSWAINHPILWYQSNSTDYFLGKFNQFIMCGARSGSGFPNPCVWP
ncbi:MAG: SH3 domain-containing protein [Anaerolineaceae bacterium]|nr:SH3 domain-containing protein [Anaerolineaceae bacterium]